MINENLRSINYLTFITRFKPSFVQEQALEREQEREEFQQELGQLQTIVKEKEKKGSQEHRLQREVRAVTSLALAVV